jgi:hypothetical protein
MIKVFLAWFTDKTAEKLMFASVGLSCVKPNRPILLSSGCRMRLPRFSLGSELRMSQLKEQK